MRKITFTRKTFDEDVAADILDGEPRATRAEISAVANRWLRQQYLAYQPDRRLDSFGNFAAFVRRYPNAARLAFAPTMGIDVSERAMPDVVVEDA
jgi:hypothetical protein